MSLSVHKTYKTRGYDMIGYIIIGTIFASVNFQFHFHERDKANMRLTNISVSGLMGINSRILSYKNLDIHTNLLKSISVLYSDRKHDIHLIWLLMVYS